MKVLLASFNLAHGVNPLVSKLLEPLPEFQPASVDDCDAIVISFICPPCDFVLDKPLLEQAVNRRVPVVIIDHTETMPTGFVLGKWLLEKSNAYYELNEAVRTVSVRGYFKRELLSNAPQTHHFPIFPIDWTIPDAAAHAEVNTQAGFNARPIDLLMSWGYSSESRPRLYGQLMRQAGKFCAHFALTGDDVSVALVEKRERIFALLFTPHYRRLPMDDIFAWQAQTKLSISLSGCGKKCFRCAEASHNSLMVQQTPEAVEWAYPWIAGKNCLGLPNGADGHLNDERAVDMLYDLLRVNQGCLYDLYLRCIHNSRNYRNTDYARNYLLPRLEKLLT